MGEWMDGLLDGRVCGYVVDGWMDGWMERMDGKNGWWYTWSEREMRKSDRKRKWWMWIRERRGTVQMPEMSAENSNSNCRQWGV